MRRNRRETTESGAIISIASGTIISTAYFYILINTPLRLSLIGAIPALNYAPRHKGLWLVCVAMTLAAALLARRLGKARGARFLWALPVLAPSILTLFIGAEGMGRPECLLALADLILAGILTAKARAGRWAKRTAGALSAALLVPTLLLALPWLALGGEDATSVSSYPCPDADVSRTAEVRISDEGATGGSTTVTVLSDFVKLPFGSLRIEQARRRAGWIDPGALEVRWLDSDTIAINGEAWNWRAASRE